MQDHPFSCLAQQCQAFESYENGFILARDFTALQCYFTHTELNQNTGEQARNSYVYYYLKRSILLIVFVSISKLERMNQNVHKYIGKRKIKIY